MNSRIAFLFVTFMLVLPTWANEPTIDPNDRSQGIDIAEVNMLAVIDGQQLSLDIRFQANTLRTHREMVLVAGEAVLERLDPTMTGAVLDYQSGARTYALGWPHKGLYDVHAQFMVKPFPEPQGLWRQASITVPGGRMRRIRLVSQRPDLEVELPGALRVQRTVDEETLTLTAILGPRQPLVVRWKPLVTLTDAKLVLSSQVNTVVNVQAGLLQIDSMFDFQVAQGKIEDLSFNVPADLNITAVHGQSLRHWEITPVAEGRRTLIVQLSRPQDRAYRLHVQAETGIGVLPARVEVPVIEPRVGLRASGHLVVGTDNALQLVMQNASGLTQIDGAMFPRVPDTASAQRAMPRAKAFYYVYAGSRYQVQVSVDDIVPTYDVSAQFVTQVKEDDLILEATLELDVRDAPLRQLEVALTAHLVVASVQGQQVEDYHLSGAAGADQPGTVRVLFKEPVLGRTLITLRLELGRGPLDEQQTIDALRVIGAKTQRGYVVVTTEAGIELTDPQVQNLREVHAASIPLRVARAQFAFRFRQADWTLTLLAQRKSAGVRAEVFHLQSIGESLAHGSAVINYIITGSPVDQLQFTLPAGLDNVEFVGRDVRRQEQSGQRWTVQLNRKVIGDYNLAVTYTQRYSTDTPIQLGALLCDGVQTQTGFVVVTSHLDLNLTLAPKQANTVSGLLAITMDELPGEYRLLTSSPILATYKYVSDPHSALCQISPYTRSGLLPVILDIATHQTTLALRPDGQIESVTVVRYKVKNTTGQFLPVAMPAHARVWAVRHIRTVGKREQATRLATSRDSETGQLLIPLRRHSNPNDPMTIELEYGQVHPDTGWWRQTVDLAAPRCTVPIAYADWQVTVPDHWVIQGVGGTMHTTAAPTVQPGLARVLTHLGKVWAGACNEVFDGEVLVVIGAVAVFLLGLCAWLRRAWLPNLLLLCVLAGAVGIGIGVSQQSQLDIPDPVVTVKATQAVSTDASEAMQVSAILVPRWRQSLTRVDLSLVPGVLLAVLALGIWVRRLRGVAVAALMAGSLFLAAKITATWPVLHALFTWGLPSFLMAWLCVALVKRCRRPLPQADPSVVATAVVLLVSLFLVGGCVEEGLVVKPITARPMIESIDCTLVTDEDSMELTYDLRIAANEPADFNLLSDRAVLISDPKPQAYLTLKTEKGQHRIVVERAGVYELSVRFLLPLPKADQNQQRQFALHLPLALSNHVAFTVPDANVLIQAREAVHLVRVDESDKTGIVAMFAPGQPALFHWQPKERQAAQEQTRFYVQDHALANVTSGLVQVYHALRLQIAQGQVDTLTLDIAEQDTVTAVAAPHVGGWRFDPAAHRLEVKLTRPVTGTYELLLVTQSAHNAIPFDIRLEPVRVQEAVNQRNIMGLRSDPSVFVEVTQHPAPMNTRDYVRDNAELIKHIPGMVADQITKAYRFDAADQHLTGKVLAVESELRSRETARFNVEDDRLVYNSDWIVDITKAGRFDVDLIIPAGFDIDTLVSDQVSHWDDTEASGLRRVRVHFKRKLTGAVSLKLALSQPVAQIPAQLTVPHVALDQALKHTGQLAIGSEQGVRLSVATRQGVSEVNPAELGQPGQGVLAFRLLRPDWQLTLQTEIVQPRVTVQGLHVAKVTDGLVRHQHTLRYQLFHAGIKTFNLTLPADVAGVTISGPNITRREQTGQGQWRVELADKVYGRPYLLRVTYETRYDPAQGKVSLVQIRCDDADLQQGHTVVFATDRVELSAEAPDAALRPAEARSIPTYFGAGDLSGAAMCYRSVSAEATLVLQAKRHGVAAQIGADVQRTRITTVVTETGQTINQVALTLRVGDQRHLQATLPAAAAIWSLAVDGQAVQPSVRANAEGREVLLVALPQQATDDVIIDMVYVASVGSKGLAWTGARELVGPRFDLPLKQITWQVYVPQGYGYSDFGGTLTLDPQARSRDQVSHYGLQSYERNLVETNRFNDNLAQQQQQLARQLAQQGEQEAARRALSKGFNFSMGNAALNEDIRVDLDNLLKQQVKVGLVNNRGRLRQQAEGIADSAQPVAIPQAQSQQVRFNQQQADRIESSLSQADSENLELITRRIIQTQAAAQAPAAQLQITMPTSGKLLSFSSPLQVEPAAKMAVSFRAKTQRVTRLDAGYGFAFGLFAVLLAFGGVVRYVGQRWDRLHAFLTPVAKPKEVKEESTSEAVLKDTDGDDIEGPVSADELL